MKIRFAVAGLALLGLAHAAAPLPPANPVQTDAERKAFAPNDQSPVAVINAFDQLAFFDHHPVEAMQKYLAPNFIERSPDFILPGYDSDKAASIAIFAKRGWKPNGAMKDSIFLVFGDQHLVTVFHRVTMKPGTAGFAYADIFRVEHGLITEHWAVAEPVPANTSARHSMF